jgi:hypothetical protein
MCGCSRDCAAAKAKIPYGMAMSPRRAATAGLGRDIELSRGGCFVARAIWAAAEHMRGCWDGLAIGAATENAVAHIASEI